MIATSHNPLADQLATLDVHRGDRAVLDRIAARFDRVTNEGCILITGSCGTAGRPRISVDSVNTKCARVIVAFRDDKSLWSKSWQTRHHCGNARCVNPAHLTHGTQDDNEADKRAHGTAMQGAKHWSAKLTEDQARAVLHAEGTQREIATRFGISPQQVSSIKRGYSWSVLRDEHAETEQ